MSPSLSPGLQPGTPGPGSPVPHAIRSVVPSVERIRSGIAGQPPSNANGSLGSRLPIHARPKPLVTRQPDTQLPRCSLRPGIRTHLPPSFPSGRVAEAVSPLFKRLLGKESLMLLSVYARSAGPKADSGAILGRRPRQKRLMGVQFDFDCLRGEKRLTTSPSAGNPGGLSAARLFKGKSKTDSADFLGRISYASWRFL